jgi:hypothetical protein
MDAEIYSIYIPQTARVSVLRGLIGASDDGAELGVGH